ncbi:GNAT family acetyltransferase [Oleiphilus messinensis]|uniref:L-2,4-diaminobutyric acid acetyltransferase n=1 Tax=Oleiphilus messinensis TaxID=141451 RepID=A0A1Y0I4Y0_9GAMM|nr:diaminobutyrate acetyltransferase [Oleiphilus messinensis]ARU55532.1 GNAT family acetyltransferase [Oleiphilus messinensis]
MDDSINDCSNITFRPPSALDGAQVHRLVSLCPPLDPNSMYCNLLQCSHFSDTSVAAVSDDVLVGFISGYLIPNQSETLFIWQVAVGEQARGQGLAGRMIEQILLRSACSDVRYLNTTITESNQASWRLFESIARRLGAELNSSVYFDRDQHFAGDHDSEMLVRIGPFSFGTRD